MFLGETLKELKGLDFLKIDLQTNLIERNIEDLTAFGKAFSNIRDYLFF